MAANILVANAHLVGLWLQMLATGTSPPLPPSIPSSVPDRGPADPSHPRSKQTPTPVRPSPSPPRAPICTNNSRLVLARPANPAIWLCPCVTILYKKRRQGLSVWLPAAAAVMLVSTLIDLIVEMIRGYHAFGIHGAQPPNPSAFYADASTPESLLKNALNVIVAVISDLIMVYRTFIIWNMNIAVILIPTGIIFANIAIGIWAMWTLSRTRVGDVLILADVTVRIRYFFILTFCVNMLCATLICAKIWRVHRLARRVSDASSTRNVLEIVIESAAVYCAYLFVLIVTSSVGSNVFFIFLDPLPPVTAVVFSMLIVRAQTYTLRGPTGGRGGGGGAPPTSTIRFGSRTFGDGDGDGYGYAYGQSGATSTTARNTNTNTNTATRTSVASSACAAGRGAPEGFAPVEVEIDLERAGAGGGEGEGEGEGDSISLSRLGYLVAGAEGDKEVGKV
ncbi:hypothetical protein BD414DRAFT_539195 [Trametes punicea]|nr:hypothetical protein BD414DRAFT_539195 [Trametes punicea]